MRILNLLGLRFTHTAFLSGLSRGLEKPRIEVESGGMVQSFGAARDACGHQQAWRPRQISEPNKGVRGEPIT